MGKRRNKRSHSPRPQARRLRFEPLEERTLLATFSVMNANNAGAGSLHQAVLDANAAPGADSITFAPALAGATISTINLTITDDVDIQGPLGGPVVLSGESSIFRDFVGAGRILDIAAGAEVSISRLTLTNGDAFNPDPFFPTGQAFGGAIRNAGTLTVRQCLFYHNGASEPNEGIGGGGGGAIYNTGTLTVIASSFAANFADWGSGGAIYNDGTASVSDSTFIDNYVGIRGGAIFNNTLRTMTVTNSTILKSGGDPQSGVLGLPTGSGGITNWGTMTLNNTIVADTPVGSDVENISIIFASQNLIKDGSGGLPGTITGDPMLTPPDYTGSSTFPALALLPRPGLKGAPFTIAPLPGSPAIDAGNTGVVSSAVDQRGAPRVNNGVVDIGAVEVGIAPVEIIVTTLADEQDGWIDPALGAGTSLREALFLTLPQHVTITFAPGLAGTIALDSSMGSLVIDNFPSIVPYFRGEVTLVGPGADVVTIDGQSQMQILVSDHPLSISGLTFARGDANDSGGAIHNTSYLTLSDCAFLDNSASQDGGAIYHNGNSLIVDNSTFVGNSSAGHGGAIAFAGSNGGVTVTDSTFAANSSTRGGAIWVQSYKRNNDPFVRPIIASSTFSENSATEYGGAILVASYQQNEVNGGQLTVINSTISNNTAGEDGGGILVSGNLDLYGSTVYGNSTASVGGGGISISDDVDYVGMVTLVNNIVAGSTSGADLHVFIDYDGTVIGDHNLIGDGSHTLIHDAWGELQGTITGDPLLGPLADNGGPTKTHALLPGSPAIDAGGVEYGIEVLDGPVAAISDPGFETPSLTAGSHAYNPTGSAWTFSGSAGLATSGSALKNPASLQGAQAAFLQSDDSSISQVVHLYAGRYLFSLLGAQPRDIPIQEAQAFGVWVDGVKVDVVVPYRIYDWTPHTTASFTVTEGLHTIEFVGQDLNRIGFLEQIELIAYRTEIHTVDLSTTDQRGSGFAREIGNAVDIGAFELQTAPLAGDYNRNGTVDAADYVVWRKTLGTTGVTPYSGADGDGNTAIEPADNTVWTTNFGRTLPIGASGTSNMAGQGSPAAESSSVLANPLSELVVLAPTKAMSTAAETNATARAAGFAELEIRSPSQPSNLKSLARVRRSQLPEQSVNHLALLLAVDQVRRNAEKEVTADPRGDEDRIRNLAGNLADEPLSSLGVNDAKWRLSERY